LKRASIKTIKLSVVSDRWQIESETYVKLVS